MGEIITFLTPAFNADEKILRVQKSLSRLKTPYVWHIWDDGSKNGIQNYLPKNHRAIIHSDGQNMGKAFRLNQLIQICNTELLCIADADDEIIPHNVDYAIQYLLDNPTLISVWGNCINQNNEEIGVSFQNQIFSARDYANNLFYGEKWHIWRRRALNKYSFPFIDRTYIGESVVWCQMFDEFPASIYGMNKSLRVYYVENEGIMANSTKSKSKSRRSRLYGAAFTLRHILLSKHFFGSNIYKTLFKDLLLGIFYFNWSQEVKNTFLILIHKK